MNYVLEKNSESYELMGGKATALSKMGKAIDNIPDWFVVSYQGFDIDSKTIKEEAILEIEERIKDFSDEDRFAIRSSAGNEDSAENSFAGQFETYLYVRKWDIVNKVRDVYMSAFSDRIETYRRENGIEEVMVPSAIVQKMVNSEKSGVAFGANPVNSNIKQIVVSAVYGLGSGLVDGIATADTYTIENGKIDKQIATKDYMHVLENDQVIQKDVEEDLKNIQVLTDKQINEVKELVKKASDYFGRYQDIEWAYEGDNLYLLQSRPITTLTSNKEGKLNVFDNSNIVESYGGITTPLTFSFIRMVYENVYIELCKIFNVEQEKIEMNSQMFKSMLALIDGRVYYNLYGWYGMLSMFPGLGNNKKFMESMMGVKESLPDDLFPVPEPTFKDKMGLVNTGWGLVKGFIKLRKMTQKFYGRLNAALKDKDIDNMDLYELHDYYYELERQLLHKWDAPLVNDFLAMIFYGKLREECKNLFNEQGDLIHNDLLCNEGGIISSEPAKRIKEMARLVTKDDSLLELLESKDNARIQKELPKYEEFNKLLNAYLDKFADRCLEELKLETLTLRDNPSNLYSSIATFARRLRVAEVEDIDERKNREIAEKKVREKLKYKPLDKAKFDFILKNARYTVKNRENLRFERTRLFGRVRNLFLRIGYILTSMNVIEEKRDIFYLEVDEILFYIDGKSTTNNLKELIAIRKAQYMKYQNTAPDERFYSYGAVNIGNDFKKEKKSASESSAKVELKGIGASPGIVTGKVRIIKDPTNAKLEQGEILVAEFTDPGWIMLFPAASGILVERGSLLSHSAIVSRELGIPAVVGITGLINSLETGDTVELNGTTGEVKVISKAEDEIVENPYTLKDLLRSTVIKYGDKILYLDRKITFKEFGDNVNALGTALLDLSLEGKKIGIISENRVEWELAFMAIACGVGTAIGIDKSLPKEEIINIINRAGIEAIFCSSRYEGLIQEIRNENEYLKQVFLFDGDGESSINSLIVKGKELIKNGFTSYIKAKPYDSDTCTILFTSGTTDRSKAVELTNKNICFNIINTSKTFVLCDKDIVLCVLPLNHIFGGIFVSLNAFYNGCQKVFCNEIDEIVDYIRKYRITFMAAVPAIYTYLSKRLDDLGGSQEHINAFMSGAARLDPSIIEKFERHGYTILQGYGLTETSPVVCIENKENRKIGSVGRPIPETEVRINPLSSDYLLRGELSVKGDHIMKGYYDDYVKTKERIDDGWFYTGDIARIDEDGFVFIEGRADDMLVLQNGKKVFPDEIEEKLNQLDGIRESLVYEKDGKLYSKMIYDENFYSNMSFEDIHNHIMEKVSYVNNALPEFKKIFDIDISTIELEKTSTGKIKRNIEAEKKSEEANGNESESTFDKVRSILINQLGDSEIREESNLRSDLCADSLDMVEINLAIERTFNIKIDKDEFKNVSTVKDLINIVDRNK